VCPICNCAGCYREITPYWRYVVEAFPEFRKEQIPIARFTCRRRNTTFSLLPIQLIPYFLYTVNAVIGTLLVAFRFRQMGQKGSFGASINLDPESLVTPWLISCWLVIVLQGLRRGHRALVRFYDFSKIWIGQKTSTWEEAVGYFMAFDLGPQVPWAHAQGIIERLLYRYSHSTARFLFGTPSQYRLINNPAHRP